MNQIQSSEDFDTKVIKNTKPVLVDFFATWCGPCKKLTPLVEELATLLHDKIEVYKLNVDEVGDIATQYSIQSIPTLIIFKQGKDIIRHTGFLAKAELKKWVEDNL